LRSIFDGVIGTDGTSGNRSLAYSPHQNIEEPR
jgi:hypothetical protein